MVLDGRGVLATIYTDRVTAVARDGLVPHPVLLGRAIAHEVGHLLGLPHGRGIMRARFNAASLRSERRGTSWLFATHEAKAIRLALQREPELVARSLDSRQD